MYYSGRTSDSEAPPTYQQSEDPGPEGIEKIGRGQTVQLATYGCDEKFKMFGQLP